MTNLIKQIGVGFLLMIFAVIMALVIAVVWTFVLIYAMIEWVIEYDGGRQNNLTVTVPTNTYKDYVSPTFFSTASLPSANVVKATTPRHSLRGPNGRFIKRITTPIEIEPLKTPVTRYGVPTHVRFANNG